MSDSHTTMPTTGRWGWYRDHAGNEFRRVSKLLEYIETKPGTFNLRRWEERQVALGLAARNDLVLGLKSMPTPDPAIGYTRQDKDKIDKIVGDAKTAAKQRDGGVVGTAVHDLTERYDRGEPLDRVAAGLPALPASEIRAYAFLIERNGWKVVEIERTVQIPELGDVTGSLDRVYEIPGLSALLGPGGCQYGDSCPDVGLPGHSDTVIGDVKTEAQPWLNGMHIAPQLAIYSRASKVWHRLPGETQLVRGGEPQFYPSSGDPIMVPNGEYRRARCVRQDVGVVVHVHDGHAHPYFVRLDAGWRSALRAFDQMLDENEAKRKMGAAGAWFGPMPNIVEPGPAEILTAVAVAADYANPNRPGAATYGTAGPQAPAVPPVEHPVGAVVTVAGMDFVKHSELPGAVVNASPVTVTTTFEKAHPVMVGTHFANEPGDTLAVAGQTTHEAYRANDGLVRWKPVEAGSESGPTTAQQPEPHVDGLDLRSKLIASIWQATTIDRLSELWQLAQQHGVLWTGPVKMAGEARQRQIGCPQRSLHVGQGKCACGWMTGVPA